MTDNGNGSYTMKFATCTTSVLTEPECQIENADGTEESIDLDVLYNHIGGEIVDDLMTALPLWPERSDEPTPPVFDLYELMSFGFLDSNDHELYFESYAYAPDEKSVVINFESEYVPTRLMPMVSYWTEESLSEQSAASIYAIGIQMSSIGWWFPKTISLDEACGMSNGILLHEYSYYNPSEPISDNTVRLLVERISETSIKLSVVEPNENGSIKLHLESAPTNNIDLAPLAKKTVSNISLQQQIQKPQMHSNDEALSYDFYVEYHDGNGYYLSSTSLNESDFTCDNVEIYIAPSAEYVQLVYTEYYSGHLCVSYRTDLIKVSEFKTGNVLPSNNADRYLAT
jgi:hypothetical protein